MTRKTLHIQGEEKNIPRPSLAVSLSDWCMLYVLWLPAVNTSTIFS